ncbi:MAG: TRAP transporter large permease [Thermodesulfobacteriota bacterium]
MSAEMTGVVGICILLILIFMRMNIGLSMASVGFFGFAGVAGIKSALGMLGTTVYNTVAYYPLTVVPLFILMGAVISHSGLGEVLFEGAYKWLGHLRGGLATATIAACAVFAAMCGSSTAETVTIGRIALPEMKRYNYSDSFACGCVACAGSLAVLIPPSIGFLMYGILTEQSVGVLFIAGIIPGILLSALFVGTVLVITALHPQAGPAGSKTPLREKIRILKVVGPVSVLLLLVLGGIYVGVFTPTEAGAVGAFGAIMVTLIAGYLSPKKLLASITETGTTTSMILMLMIGAFIFMKFLAISKLTFALPRVIGGLGLSPYVALFAIILFYIVLGMFFEIMSGMVLTIPLVYPVVMHLGFDPIWFGVILVLLMEMGLATPPIGLNVFLLSTVTDVPLRTIFKGVWPFIAAICLCLALVILFPQIALFLPNKMMSK